MVTPNWTSNLHGDLRQVVRVPQLRREIELEVLAVCFIGLRSPILLVAVDPPAKTLTVGGA